ILHPYHDWHDDLAEEYFNQFPDAAASYQYEAQDSLKAVTAKHALINDIYKGKTFHQEPLYTYMLAITYAIFGPDVQWVYFWQILLAAFTSVLVFLIGRHFFGSLCGLIAALFVTFCASIMVYELVLLRTTLTNFLTVLLLYLFIRAMSNPDWKQHLFFGIASGFALLAQTYFILFLLPAWIWLIWMQRKTGKSVAINSLTYIGALLVVMSPLFIRNIRAGVPIAASASHGAMAYIPMNIQNAYPMESFYVHMPSLARIRHDSDGKMIPAMILSLKTFDSIDAFWKIYKQKFGGLFMWYEIPNNMNYYLHREIAPFLKLMPVRYFFIAPLGLAGLLLGLWRYRWRMMPLVLMTIVSIIPMLIAGDFARYRTPLVIMMCLFAAFFIIEILTLFYQKNSKIAFIGIGIALLALVFTVSSVEKKQFVYNVSDFDPFYRHFYMDRLIKYEEESNYQEYLNTTTMMVEDIPDYYLKVPANQRIVKSNEAQTSSLVANYLENHYNILTFLEKNQEAAFYKERMTSLRARAEDFNKRVGIQ
ncbi:MAG TPA: glycosyltransferase family 39 protein, partial [Flavitalea sp.]|nr:glycosyltransferase family 39 protein [Flavitalea sp.]